MTYNKNNYWQENNQRAEYIGKACAGCGCLLLPFCLLAFIALLLLVSALAASGNELINFTKPVTLEYR